METPESDSLTDEEQVQVTWSELIDVKTGGEDIDSYNL